MLAKERHLRIISTLKSNSFITISELSKDLNVSKSTVQRDLKFLEENGKVKRERGGAVNLDIDKVIHELIEEPVIEKININCEVKEKIAQEAASIISDGDLVFIDSGTTPLNILQFVQNKKIKVVTNSTFVLKYAAEIGYIDVYMLGGKYNLKQEVCFGSFVIEQISNLKFDKAFMGANGLDLSTGEVYVSDLEIGNIKRKVIQNANTSLLLIDDSKMSLTSISKFGNVDMFDKIYTNKYMEDMKNYNNFYITE